MKEKEQELLQKLYECQEMMEDLLDKGKDDKHYLLMEIVIERLEEHISKNNFNIM